MVGMKRSSCLNGIVPLMLGLMMLWGCSKPNTVVGDWTVTLPGNVTDPITFKSDGTFVLTILQKPVTITIAGAYRDAGKTLYMTMKQVNVPPLPPEAKGQ